jgi:hypothetical protein
MNARHLTLGLLVAGCFTVATWVGPQFEQLDTRRETGFLAQTLGESRRLFANHFFTRSDVYFHSGYYPSIFDAAGKKKENHLAETAGAKSKNPAHGEPGHVHNDHEEGPAHGEPGHVCNGHDEEEHNFLGKPKDWLDGFTRNFFVSKHTHLTEKGTNAPREILPWLKLSAQLDPQLVESYTVGAYWLRQLNKDAEAEQFLREGLRHNPGSYEIMLELGRCYFDRKDYERARNVLEMAMRRWREQENPKPDDQRNRFSAEQIVNYLVLVEDRTGRREQTIAWLGVLKRLSPHPEEIEKRIAEVRAGKSFEAH